MTVSDKRGSGMDRREFLALGAAGAGALALNALPFAVQPAFAAAQTALPHYFPAPVAPADVPGNATGLEPSYTKFPDKLVSLVKAPPGKGGDVTGLQLWNSAIPTPTDSNAAWQQLNKALNVNLKMNLVAQSDYGTKWGTVMAGGDLPDLMYVTPAPRIPNVAGFMKAACADLTEHLSGDAVKDYPGLANIPTASWRSCVIDNKLWGIPVPRSVTGYQMFIQTSLVDKLGLGSHYWPKNADDFKAFCKDLTNPSQNRWAIGMTNDNTSGPYAMYWFQGVFGAPNNWRLNKDGTLIKNIEAPEYKAALGYLRELVSLGYVSPDVKSNSDIGNDFYSDRIAMRSNVWAQYTVGLLARAAKLNKTFRTIPPFGADGGPGTTMQGPGNIGYVTMKRGTPDRVKEILGVLNYIASPIGSTEYMIARYGVKDVDWAFDPNGVPIYTKQGLAEIVNGPTQVPWGFMAGPAPFNFSPDVPDFGKWGAEEDKKFVATGVADPTLGYYSPAEAKMGTQLEQLIFDRVTDMAAGRRPLSDLDQLAKDWRAGGGDTMRAEFQKAIGA